MRSNGGVATFAAAATAQRANDPQRSGGGRRRVGAHDRRAPGFENVVTFDMGGTSTDVALIQNCQPVRASGGKVHGRDVLVADA